MCRATFGLLTLFICMAPVSAQTSVYSPLSTWQPSLSSWESARSSLEASSKQQSARPVLAGLRPVTIELLQDALLRKHHKLLRNNSGMARRVILDKYLGKGTERSRINGRNQLNGAMAEALFLHKNPDWKYVSKPNASQHDVYRLGVGKRPPLNGQVKFHVSGRPDIYARDMAKDYRAHRFFVPDDHVQPVREYWRRQYEAAKVRGDSASAQQAARNTGRVQPMGVNSHEVVTSTKQASQFAAAETRAVYVSLAAGVALSLGQIGWDYAHGTLSADQAAYRSTKAFTLIGTGIAADATLLVIRQGALRGTLKGNLIVGGVVLLVETSWNVYEHGGMAAFRHPEFYEQLGGSVSAIGIGGVAGFYSGVAATAAASELGPVAPVVGAATGLVVATGVGIVAYIGGRSATGWLIRTISPELYQQYEQQQIAATKQLIRDRIAKEQSAIKERSQ
jgi:hypothetical protein